jgi:hypothetical protein
LGFSDRRIAILEDSPGIDQKRFACRRQRDSFAPSVEQLYPKFAFQIVDLLTERRLRNVQPIRGVREVQLLGGSDEVFKMAELHGQL